MEKVKLYTCRCKDGTNVTRGWNCCSIEWWIMQVAGPWRPR